MLRHVVSFVLLSCLAFSASGCAVMMLEEGHEGGSGSLSDVAAQARRDSTTRTKARPPEVGYTVPAAADTLAASTGEAVRVAPVPQRRPLSFTPHRFDQCAFFAVLEASWNRGAMETGDSMDKFLITNGIGLMKNIDQHWAVGGVVDLHWEGGVMKVAPTVRCRRWFAGEQSVEASLGYIANPTPTNDVLMRSGMSLVGPIVSARYSPTPGFFVQGGMCRYREQRYDYDPPTYTARYSTHDSSKAYGGIGLSGPGGAVAWGVELLALGLALALFDF